MKILHLVSDEKFINFIADTFNTCENVSNTFYATVKDVNVPLKHITDVDDIHVININSILSKKTKQDLMKYDAIIVHYLDFMKATLSLMAPSHIPIVWSGWGGDYYCYIGKGEKDFLGMESLFLHNLLNNKLSRLKLLILIKKSTNFLLRPIFNMAIRRTDYFSSPIPEDFDLLKSNLGSDFKAEYIQINYGSVEKTFSIGSANITGNNILVGNSATFTNNHFEVFRILSNINLESRKIVVPLSYGNTAYRDAVIEQGNKLFGDKFYPIVYFMPLEQYISQITSCSVVVMGHRRQQAVGNTATMLYKGTKVFLDETSTVYQFFKNRGAVVYGLKELKEGGVSALAPLTYDQKSKNREVLESFWGHKVVLKNTQDLVEILRLHKGCTIA